MSKSFEEDEDSSETFKVEIDKRTYKKLKDFAEENETTAAEEIGNAFTSYYEDVTDDDLDLIEIISKKDKIEIVLSENLYAILEEEADNNSTDPSEELILLIEEYLDDEEGEETEYGEDDEEPFESFIEEEGGDEE